MSLKEVFVPLLVEFLVLLDMGLLALLTLLRLVEDEFLVAAIVVLLLELNDPVFGHLSLHILAFLLTRVPVILQHLTKIVKQSCVRKFEFSKSMTSNQKAKILRFL